MLIATHSNEHVVNKTLKTQQMQQTNPAGKCFNTYVLKLQTALQ
jgi:hypothetical protein